MGPLAARHPLAAIAYSSGYDALTTIDVIFRTPTGRCSTVYFAAPSPWLPRSAPPHRTDAARNAIAAAAAALPHTRRTWVSKRPVTEVGTDRFTAVRSNAETVVVGVAQYGQRDA
jgi:hypothetical protein